MYNVLGRVLAVVFCTTCVRVFPSFLLSDIATDINKKHKANVKLHLDNTALLVAPLQSAQSLPNSLSGKDTAMQTLGLTHRLDPRFLCVLGGWIAE